VSQDLSNAATPLPEAAIPVAPGQVVGDRYMIGSIIGEGGMGVVCAATHLGLGTPVAIKLIRSDLKDDAESVVRFINEAKTAASLKGDHIARVYDVGQLETGEPYLVMEQLEGIGLDAFIREKGPLPQTEAVDIVLQVCEGLMEAHAVALVHRDIKPGNLFLARRPDGNFVLKILDFGISKRPRQGPVSLVTNPGRSMGSPWYMSPEQMMNPAAVDQRADIWSLGVLLYELLINDFPFTGDGVVQVCANVLVAPTPLPSTRRADIDPRLDAVVLRCLEKKAEARFQSVMELAEALQPLSSRAQQAPSIVAPSEGLALEPELEIPIQVETPIELRRVREETNPECVREIATNESVAPVATHITPRHRWPTAATAVFFVMLGAGASWLSWPYLYARYGALDWQKVEQQLRLPWDPTLKAGPATEPVPLDRELPTPQFSVIRHGSSAVRANHGALAAPSQGALAPTSILAPASSDPVSTISARVSPDSPPGPRSSSAAELSAEKIRQRLEQYQSWLRQQGLAPVAPAPAPAPTMDVPDMPNPYEPKDHQVPSEPRDNSVPSEPRDNQEPIDAE
jgi:serine/threonine protein kinase